jgi:leucyl aminopeptidase (aminopeptidase T)
VLLSDRQVGSKEIPVKDADLIASSDVVIIALQPEDACQLWHTTARMNASAAGARIGLLFPPATWDLSYDQLLATKQLTDALAALLHTAEHAHLTAPGGTDLTMSLAGREAFSCHSLIAEPGATATIPDWGDAETSPLESTAQGRLVIDGSMSFIGVIHRPIDMTVLGGSVTEVKGGDEAARLRAILDKAGPTGRNIAELGIGTVARGGITGHKDDKLFGTAHVALGHNVSLGGTVESSIHLDGVLMRPTLILDDRQILVDGALAPWLEKEIS